MRIRRGRRDHQAVSLFPFLAVLVCTMGVLILLLVLAVKSADNKARHAKQQQQEKIQRQLNQVAFELETQQLRIQGLTELRPDVQRRLQEARLRRSHIEQQLRKLRQEAAQLQQTWQQLDEDVALAHQSQGSDHEQMQAVQQQIAARQTQLTELRRKLADRPAMYSIVPTQTQSGTQRRPIYVECTPTGIVLQPSGIVLSLEEFAIPIIPGNPLDAALLAIREYWNSYTDIGEDGEPYPLLVVRPGGATAYAVARRAMQSWDDEFGYELVEADKLLDFGAEDKNLTQIVRHTVDEALRKQQQWVVLQQAAQPGDRSKLAGRLRRSLNSRIERQSAVDMSSVHPEVSRAENGGDQPSAPNPLRDSSASADGAHSTSSQRSDRDVNAEASPTAAGNANLISGQTSAEAVASLAGARGADWALPTRTPGATAYRRPIRVECSNTHLHVYSGEADQPPTEIPVAASLEATVDRLVEQVWRQIESWGMAEAGGFWKPVLRLHELPGGRDRVQQLARMLEGSGLEIEGAWR